jgi:hypothetical protein
MTVRTSVWDVDDRKSIPIDFLTQLRLNRSIFHQQLLETTGVSFDTEPGWRFMTRLKLACGPHVNLDNNEWS